MKYIYEILNEFIAAPTWEEAIAVLRANAGDATFRLVLQGAFHPGIQYVIKEIPPYKRSDAPAGLGYTDINREIQRVYLFVEGSTRVDPNLTLERKSVILAQMLEAMEPNEATVFANMIMKDLQIPGLRVEIIREALPGLIP